MTNAAISPEVNINNDAKPLDPNRYATKKTIAQGMLDIALLTANASQLKYILQVGHKHEFYSLMLGLITTSIILQMAVGILFLIIGGLDINQPHDHLPATIINDIILIIVFLISILNVLISGFGMEHSSQPLQIVLAGVLYVVLGRLNITTTDHSTLAANLNHLVLSSITIVMFVNIIKMGFGFELAIPVTSVDVEH